MTTSNKLAQIPAKLYDLLSTLSPEERKRAVQATMVLFGDESPSPVSPTAGSGGTTLVPPSAGDIPAFFEQKAPKNKGEELAVAARYREMMQQGDSHSKDDLKKVITGARRNFDDSNFARDINNAKRQAGFFNIGTGRNASKLSYYGQQFVNALPDRDAASKLKKPKAGRAKMKTAPNKRETKQ